MTIQRWGRRKDLMLQTNFLCLHKSLLFHMDDPFLVWMEASTHVDANARLNLSNPNRRHKKGAGDGFIVEYAHRFIFLFNGQSVE